MAVTAKSLGCRILGFFKNHIRMNASAGVRHMGPSNQQLGRSPFSNWGMARIKGDLAPVLVSLATFLHCPAARPVVIFNDIGTPMYHKQ